VYKLSKALYMLKQASRAWYARLKTFLRDHGYVMGSTDNMATTFYLFRFVWMISFSITLLLCQKSMMGELTFFIGIHVKQTKQDTHQAKYKKDIMKKFNMAELKPMQTPMSTVTALDLDENCKTVDQREYRSMIDSLFYLTMTRSDI
jgi:hypothetical protein